ncbi:hypothetical protein C8Q73DRAFT_93041 [Cubamyces lactineus]|nr:hypothetical protein C8Q73DRAFT_93041 [Cubamyces lactineus]
MMNQYRTTFQLLRWQLGNALKALLCAIMCPLESQWVLGSRVTFCDGIPSRTSVLVFAYLTTYVLGAVPSTIIAFSCRATPAGDDRKITCVLNLLFRICFVTQYSPIYSAQFFYASRSSDARNFLGAWYTRICFMRHGVAHSPGTAYSYAAMLAIWRVGCTGASRCPHIRFQNG